MLLIVGGAHDAEAQSAVARLGPQRSVILDAVDLSRPGWRLFSDNPGGGTIVAGGRVVPVCDVTAVLVRRAAVYPQELAHVHCDDRNYVASEMTALLSWWLRIVPAPALNRPGGAALCGPGWRPEQWRAMANRLGFPVVRVKREVNTPAILPPVATEITLVGGLLVGEAPLPMVKCLEALARKAGVPLLSAAFDESGALLAAHAMPRLSNPLLRAIALYAGLATMPEEVPATPLSEVFGTAMAVGATR